MQVTKVSAMQTCSICERTLLLGERAVRFAPAEGAELVDVCPLCQELALEAGWIKEGAPTTPTLNGAPRRKRRLSERLGLSRAGGDNGVLTPQEPILRRLSNEETALLEAAEIFNESPYCRTVGGIAKSLGEPRASIVQLSGDSGELAVTIAWDLSWYQYRVNPGSGQPVRLERRGHELGELNGTYTEWNAHIEDGGRLVPEIAKI